MSLLARPCRLYSGATCMPASRRCRLKHLDEIAKTKHMSSEHILKYMENDSYGTVYTHRHCGDVPVPVLPFTLSLPHDCGGRRRTGRCLNVREPNDNDGSMRDGLNKHRWQKIRKEELEARRKVHSKRTVALTSLPGPLGE